MSKWIIVLFVLLVTGCKQKASLTGDGPVAYQDFAEVFTVQKLPFEVSDTTLQTVADTITISRSVFKQFVPDTIFTGTFGTDTNYTIRPVVKLEEEEEEDYFVLYAKAKKKSAVFLVVFNHEKFSAAMPMLVNNKDNIFNSASVDKKLSVAKHQEWNKGTERMYNRTIYAYNNVGVFTTVLTETNVPPVITAGTVLNPLDTFAKSNIYSGNYAKGKQSFISIRDGKSKNDYQFFIHFLREGDNPCGGDLRGFIQMTSPNTGTYSSPGDPCIIDFTFTKNTVKVKEQGSCGNYRGITCFFDDTYTRKKESKPAAKKK